MRARSSGAICFRFEALDFWATPSSGECEVFDGEIGDGAAVGVNDTGENVYEICLHTDLARFLALLCAQRRGGAAQARIATMVVATLRLRTMISIAAGATEEIFVINFTGG